MDQSQEPFALKQTMGVYASQFKLQPPQPISDGREPLLLDGYTCVVAEHIPVQGAAVGCGVPSVWSERPVATSTAPAVTKLLNLGATVLGQASTQPCSYPTLGNNIRNPAAAARVAGGGCSGAAVAVATGEADLAIASDFLGSSRLPAACMGVASSLGLPGTANLRHEVTQVVVAEDLFALCDQELSTGVLAVKRAVLAWAGQDQAGSVQLLPFIRDNTKTWQRIQTGPRRLAGTADDDTTTPSSNTAAGSSSSGDSVLPPALAAITRAAQLLYHSQLWQHHGSSVDLAAVEELDASVTAALHDGAAVTDAQLDDARAVAAQMQEVLMSAVRKDVVVVVPCIPAAPPRLDEPAATKQTWLQRCHAFAAIPALSGCPSVVLPVSLPGDPPLAVALFGQARSDQRLLAVADKLMPFVKAELVSMRDKAAAASLAESKALANGASTNSKAGSSAGSGRFGGRAARAAGKASKGGVAKQSGPGEVDARRAERAERAKLKGNEAFKAGRYNDAIKAYSEALQLQPNHPVYASNRAMAYLKIFSFEAAEADCNRALACPDLSQPDRVKALLRRGTARMHKGDLRSARSDFKEVLAAEPNNRQAQEELKSLHQQEQDMVSTQRHHARVAAEAAAAAAAAGGGDPSGMFGLPGELPGPDFPAANRLWGMGNPAGALLDPGRGDESALSADDFASLLQQGGHLPVVLGKDGQPVYGPDGAPVLVDAQGNEFTIGSAGQLMPFDRS
eukprot:gene13360-13488_t